MKSDIYIALIAVSAFIPLHFWPYQPVNYGKNC